MSNEVQAQPLSQDLSMSLVSKDPASELSDGVSKIEGRSGETEANEESSLLADSLENLKDARESVPDTKSLMPQVGTTEELADSLEWGDFKAGLEQQAIQSVAKNEPDRVRNVESKNDGGFSRITILELREPTKAEMSTSRQRHTKRESALQTKFAMEYNPI